MYISLSGNQATFNCSERCTFSWTSHTTASACGILHGRTRGIRKLWGHHQTFPIKYYFTYFLLTLIRTRSITTLMKILSTSVLTINLENIHIIYFVLFPMGENCFPYISGLSILNPADIRFRHCHRCPLLHMRTHWLQFVFYQDFAYFPNLICKGLCIKSLHKYRLIFSELIYFLRVN